MTSLSWTGALSVAVFGAPTSGARSRSHEATPSLETCPLPPTGARLEMVQPSGRRQRLRPGFFCCLLVAAALLPDAVAAFGGGAGLVNVDFEINLLAAMVVLLFDGRSRSYTKNSIG